MKTKTTFIQRAALLVLLSTIHSQLSTFAQSTAFTYQGRFNTNHVPYTGLAEFQFTLWDSASGGNAVATNNPAAVIASAADGLFTATLDFGSNPFNGQPRFLQIDARTTIDAFTTLTPRQPLTPTPYALRALNLTTNGLAAGTYASAVTFNNAGNSFNGSFTGNGAGLANVTATTLGGLGTANFWQTGGNGGTTPGAQFLGTTDNQPLEFKVNGARALRLEPTAGAPNVIGGAANNQITAPSAGGGVLSGSGHRIYNGSDYSVIAGGFSNRIQISSPGGFIGGGQLNWIVNSSTNSVIAGGASNQISRDHSFIGGGLQQTNRSAFAFIGGGSRNRVDFDSDYAVIAGGQYNTIAANSVFATVAGGYLNDIGTNAYYSAIGGGRNNYISDTAEYGTIAGGNACRIDLNANYNTIGGGFFNSIGANADYVTIAGGFEHDIGISSDYSAIGGGHVNKIAPNSQNATIAGGFQNNIGTNADHSAIGGGFNNHIAVNSAYATIPGGNDNTATNYAFAAGNRAKANHTGTFVWADSQNTDFASLRDDQFRVRADGGARFDFNAGEWVDLRYQSNFITSARIINTSSGGYLSLGGSWVNASDRARKTHFTPVDPQAVLAKVAAMPLSEWSYRTEGESVRHVGPMAQDFHAAFGLGGDDKSIGTVDADGVALAAIQGLNQKVDSENSVLRAENVELKRELSEIKQMLLNLSEKKDQLMKHTTSTPIP